MELDLKKQLAQLRKIRGQQDKLAHELFATDKFCQTDILRIIETEVCNYFELSLTRIKEPCQQSDVIDAKQTLYYVCTIYTNFSYGRIGKEYNASGQSVYRGNRRINALNTRYKPDYILYLAIENMKVNIENLIIANLQSKPNNETIKNQE